MDRIKKISNQYWIKIRGKISICKILQKALWMQRNWWMRHRKIKIVMIKTRSFCKKHKIKCQMRAIINNRIK